MSDGPHKSLNMRPGWKKLAERADLAAFEPEQVADQLMPALRDDWIEDGCDELVRRIRELVGDTRQASLQDDNKAGELESARRELSAGHGLKRLVLDSVIQAFDTGRDGSDALQQGIHSAVTELAARGARQVEEHYIRKSNEERATNVRTRINEAIERAPIGDFARRAAGLQSQIPLAKTQKQQTLDDGVSLP
ncbi:MAG: hypothetical protein ABJA10_04495 [Aestuariivirga sp.]